MVADHHPRWRSPRDLGPGKVRRSLGADAFRRRRLSLGARPRRRLPPALAATPDADWPAAPGGARQAPGDLHPARRRPSAPHPLRQRDPHRRPRLLPAVRDAQVRRARLRRRRGAAIAARWRPADWVPVKRRPASRCSPRMADLVVATMGHNTQRDGQVRFIRPHYYRSETILVGPRDFRGRHDDLRGVRSASPSATTRTLSSSRTARD